MFFRFLFGLSFLVGMIYSLLLIRYVLTNTNSLTYMCPGSFSEMPCFLFYSRFSTDNDTFYSGTLIVFVVIGTIISIRKWINFDLLRKKKELYEDRKMKYSKMFLNMWDWRTVETSFDGKTQTTAIRTELKVTLAE